MTDIKTNLSWVPADLRYQFMNTQLIEGLAKEYEPVFSIEQDAENGQWNIISTQLRRTQLAEEGRRTYKMAEKKYIQSLLNSKTPKFTDPDMAAMFRTRIDAFQTQFAQWATSTDDRKAYLEEAWRKHVGGGIKATLPPELHITPPGLAEGLELTSYQSQAVAEFASSNRNSYFLAMEVGSGKTFMSLAAFAMMKAAGKAKKALFLARNINREHIAQDEVNKFFPDMKVMTAHPKGKNIAQTLTRFAAGNDDILVLPQSSLDKGVAPLSSELKVRELVEKINEMRHRKLLFEGDTRRDAMNKLKSLKDREAKLVVEVEALLRKPALPTGIALDKMGVDFVIVDEAHNYKNLSYYSKYSGIAGMGPSSGSNKAKILKNCWTPSELTAE